MKIIIDECLPKRLTKIFSDHDAWTVPQVGLAGYKDTELLEALDEKEIDIFITIDGNIEYQQLFSHRNFGTIIIRSVSNRFSDLEHFKDELIDALPKIKASQVVHIPL